MPFILISRDTKHLDSSKLLQQKGLQDYKLATANASMNADFGMEEQKVDINHGIAAMSLDSGDAPPPPPPKQQVSPVDRSGKQQSSSKEVCFIILY